MAPRYRRASTFGNNQASNKGLTIVNGMGKQAGMSDGSGQTAWSYTAIVSVLTERRTILGVTNTISYNYNPDGSPASRSLVSSDSMIAVGARLAGRGRLPVS